ncbi:MAG: division/cell wall cluster transcriptional repressor MraZ [Acidobacteriota bacterium]|nr:division/cell wall cluster transcriptional repressor MraZ [Acidobacteriota bacterium]
MFRGNNPARVDEKGRLKLPADFKRRVDELYGPQFYITSKDGERAEIWPLKEWERIEESLALAPSSAAKQRFLDVTNYYGQVVEMDSQGRLLMPQLLREKADLKGDVAVLGQNKKLVVINDERAQAKIAASPLTGEDLDSLAIPGL